MATVFIWRWMVADREKLATRLTDVTDRHIESVEKMSEVVVNNTHAMNEVRNVMQMCHGNNER